MPVYRRARGPSRGWPSSRQLGTYYVGHSNEHPRRRRHQRGRDPQRGARAVRALPRRVLARAGRARGLSGRSSSARSPRRGWLARADPAGVRRRAGSASPHAAIILEEINRSGGNAGACHAQMYMMGTLLRHGSDEQKQRYLPGIASGELRLQAFGVTEPDAGLDTHRDPHARAAATATPTRVNGQKIWTSRALHSRPDAAARAHRRRPSRSRSAGPGSRRSSSTCARPAARSRSTRSRP